MFSKWAGARGRQNALALLCPVITAGWNRCFCLDGTTVAVRSARLLTTVSMRCVVFISQNPRLLRLWIWNALIRIWFVRDTAPLTVQSVTFVAGGYKFWACPASRILFFFHTKSEIYFSETILCQLKRGTPQFVLTYLWQRNCLESECCRYKL